jgi:multidrug efflux pump subunit AcrB
MAPLALALGEGSQLLQPLAVGVIGGLAVALVLSLVLTPTVYAALATIHGDEREKESGSSS